MPPPSQEQETSWTATPESAPVSKPLIAALLAIALLAILLVSSYATFLGTRAPAAEPLELTEHLVGGYLNPGLLSAGQHTLTFRARGGNGSLHEASVAFGVGEAPIPLPEHVDVTTFGALADGTTDDTAAIKKAIAAINATTEPHTLVFPPGRYRVTDTLRLSRAMAVEGTSTSTILLEVPAVAGQRKLLFDVRAPDVSFTNITIDGANIPASIPGKLVAIQGQRERITIRQSRFINLTAKDRNDSNPHTLTTIQGVYLTRASDSSVTDSVFDGISGAAIVFTNSANTKVLRNTINNTGWYSINYDYGCDGIEIRGNTITGTIPDARYYGGSVNIMSQIEQERNRNIVIADNHISGMHNYDSVIRVLSASNVLVENNIIDTITQNEPGNIYHIAVNARSASKGRTAPLNNGPPDNVTIRNNTLRSGARNNVGILIRNDQWGEELPPKYGERFSIEGNRILSPNRATAFVHGIVTHGNNGGLRLVEITNNLVEVDPILLPVGGITGGINVRGSSNEQKPIRQVVITGNRICFTGNTPPTEPAQNRGIDVGTFSEDVTVARNTIGRFLKDVNVAATNTSQVSVQGNKLRPDCNF